MHVCMFMCVPLDVHMCEMVYVCAHDCGDPETHLNIILRNTIHPFLRHHFSMAWRSKVSGQGVPGFHLSWLGLQVHSTVSGIYFVGTENRIQVFMVV